MRPLPNPAFAAFVAPARPGRALWRTLLGLALILAIYAGSVALSLAVVGMVHGTDAAFRLAEELVYAESPGATLFLLATFAGMAAGPLVVAPLVHRRAPVTLFGRPARVLRDFVAAAAATGALYALTVGIWSLFYDAVPGLPPATWLALLPLTLLGLLLQTGAEELVFRGYLMQQLAARFLSPLVWMLVPALLFALVHYNPELSGENAAILVGGTLLFGLFAADLTVATGSIGAAWGFHFANNVLALAVVSTQGTITGVALYLTPYAVDGAGAGRLALLADYAILTAAWAFCRLAVRR